VANIVTTRNGYEGNLATELHSVAASWT